ncbi:MAG: GIY-YIG nuclease family protein [Patescibacteria group bacterium]|nr:GIY-YIG nuclease family protein [Patescibacteria group bacterium]
MADQKKLYKNLPLTPGVYLMKNRAGKIIYVGKAVNLKRRVSSYFLRPQEARLSKMVSEINKADFLKTDTAIEALILESSLIKKYSPVYNIREKDDKSFLRVVITNEYFPRVLLAYGKELNRIPAKNVFGPFTSSSSIREALKIIRKIFPYSVHTEDKIGKAKRPCFEYEIGLCPGTCVGVISKKEYLQNIRNIRLFFEGKKERILKSLEKEMKEAAKKTEFEKAAELRRKIFSLKHIQDVALISENKVSEDNSITTTPKEKRVEGYDISNISGTSAVGSMVVLEGGEIKKSEYRLFKIKTVVGSNDVGMLKEVISRRLNNFWPMPDLIMVDGGKAQVAAAVEVLSKRGMNIPIVGIAKGPERKRNDFTGRIPSWVKEGELIKLRDEAHRFAISYHRKVRSRSMRS